MTLAPGEKLTLTRRLVPQDHVYTWSIDSSSLMMRYYLFIHGEEKAASVTFCKLFWTVVFAPILVTLELAGRSRGPLASIAISGWKKFYILLFPPKTDPTYEELVEEKLRRDARNNELRAKAKQRKARRQARAAWMAEHVGARVDRVVAFMQKAWSSWLETALLGSLTVLGVGGLLVGLSLLGWTISLHWQPVLAATRGIGLAVLCIGLCGGLTYGATDLFCRAADSRLLNTAPMTATRRWLRGDDLPASTAWAPGPFTRRLNRRTNKWAARSEARLQQRKDRYYNRYFGCYSPGHPVLNVAMNFSDRVGVPGKRLLGILGAFGGAALGASAALGVLGSVAAILKMIGILVVLILAPAVISTWTFVLLARDKRYERLWRVLQRAWAAIVVLWTPFRLLGRVLFIAPAFRLAKAATWSGARAVRAGARSFRFSGAFLSAGYHMVKYRTCPKVQVTGLAAIPESDKSAPEIPIMVSGNYSNYADIRLTMNMMGNDRKNRDHDTEAVS